MTLAEKFWQRVDQRGQNECWPWTAGCDKDGYGQLSPPGQRTQKLKAHRVAFQLAVMPIPAGLSVLHKCDNRPCCNPLHLFCGTQQDNIADCIKKGRKVLVPTGENHPNSKLNPEKILAIRASKEGDLLLAARYDVTPKYIGAIKRGERWKHVQPQT